MPFRTIRIISHLNKESIGGDGLWSVTVSHQDWWGWSMVCHGITSRLVGMVYGLSRYHIMIGEDGLSRYHIMITFQIKCLA